MINALTIDVEDYFHVSAFEEISPPASWSSRELRVDRNTDRVLSLLAEAEVKSTFFVLGWVAERCPDLIRRIGREGHEIASHGYGHQRVSTQGRTAFREDIRRSKRLLEDLTGLPVIGYRAPSYSISPGPCGLSMNFSRPDTVTIRVSFRSVTIFTVCRPGPAFRPWCGGVRMAGGNQGLFLVTREPGGTTVMGDWGRISSRCR